MSADDHSAGCSMPKEASTVGHLMADLSKVTPSAFVLNLKQAYVDGEDGKGNS